jgi:hypothetical protein
VTIPRLGRPLPVSAKLVSSSRIPRRVLMGLLFTGLGLCLSSGTSVGQSAAQRHEKPYALIFGTVWGPDDYPLYAVKVKLRRADQKKAKWEQYSDHQGELAFRVPAGKATYYVWAEVKGYKLPDGSKLQPGQEVRVEVENDERVDFGLHLK